MCHQHIHRHIPVLEIREGQALEGQALVDLEARGLMALKQARVPVWATPVLTAWTAGFVHPPRLLQLRSLVAMAGLVTTVRVAGSVSQSRKTLRRRHQCLQLCLHMHIRQQQSTLLRSRPHIRPQMGITTLAVTGTAQRERLEMPSS